MKHLLENWEEAKELLVSPIFFLSDYDGTLAPIVDRPEDAELSDGIRKRLTQLINFCPVGIISGRSLEDLESKVDIENIYYSGNHGYEISGPEVSFVKNEAEQARSAVKKICDEVKRRSSSIDGVLIEDKGVTASVHYRLVNEGDVSELEEILAEEVEPYRKDDVVEVNYGKKVFEVGPGGEWDKGEAVSLLRRITGFEEEALPVYLGDDVTDEDVFFTLKRGGIGVLVSDEERESAADFRLNGIGEVEIFLSKLVKVLEQI